MNKVVIYCWGLYLFFLVLNFTQTENSNKPMKAVVCANSILRETVLDYFLPCFTTKIEKAIPVIFSFYFFHYYHTVNKILVSDSFLFYLLIYSIRFT